jgi:hypothetical protein
MDSVTRIFASGFLMNQFPPAPEYSIRTVSNFFENSLNLPLLSTTTTATLPRVSMTPAANFSTKFFASVVDTSGKFAIGVNDTGGKFAKGVNDAGGKLPQVSTMPAANLPLV